MITFYGVWYGYGLSPSQMVKFYLFMGALILFLISGVTSYNEIRYLLFGRTTLAVLMEDAGAVGHEVRTRTGGRYSSQYTVNIAVKYAFKDIDGSIRTASDTVSPEWHTDNIKKFADVLPTSVNFDIPGHNGVTFAVQFIPGDSDRSRLRGHNYVWLTFPFVVSTLAVIGFGAWVWNDVSRFERHKAMKEKGY